MLLDLDLSELQRQRLFAYCDLNCDNRITLQEFQATQRNRSSPYPVANVGGQVS